MHKDLLEGLWKHRFLSPVSRVTDSAGLESSRTVCISNKFIGAATAAVSGSHSVVDLLLLLSRFSRVRLCATPETEAHQAPLFLGFSRQEHWSGLPLPSPGVLNTEEWAGEEHPQLKRLERLGGCVWAVILLRSAGFDARTSSLRARVSRVRRGFEGFGYFWKRSSISSCEKVGTPRRDKMVLLYSHWSFRDEISPERERSLKPIWLYHLFYYTTHTR